MNERNKEIDILKGEASKQINQIREPITKFLDKETGTLGERKRTLFKEQGIMIVSILTAIGMAIGVLIEALLGGPSVSATTTSAGTSGGDGKSSGATMWIKNKLKALLQLPGKLADKALASLPGIKGSILSWILNRAKEVIGWLSQNLWALITGVGVLIYTYFMTNTKRRYSFEQPPYCKDSCSAQYQSYLFFLIGDLIRIRFGFYHLYILFELDVRFNIMFVFFIGASVRFSFYYSFTLWLDIWFILIEIDL